MKRIYLDHNATAGKLRPACRELWLEVAEEGGNPSSLHGRGRRARQRIDEARERVAAALKVHEDEITFTSGATEANNLALFGTLRTAGEGRGLVTTAAEHSSVLAAARALAREGARLHVLGIDADGQADPEELRSTLEHVAPSLVSIQAANNEVGTLPQLERFAEVIAGRVPFHTDAVQALGRVPVELSRWGVDLASFSGHKIGAPPGVGILWKRQGVQIAPLFFGGGQEKDLRPGTENVPGIAATALALELAVAECEAFREETASLARWLWREIEQGFPAARLIGPAFDRGPRLPNTLAVAFPDHDGKVLLTRLDLEGLELSAGSACASGSLEASHVLLAMGFDEKRARAALRFSLGRDTSREDCNRVIAILKKVFAHSHAT